MFWQISVIRFQVIQITVAHARLLLTLLQVEGIIRVAHARLLLTLLQVEGIITRAELLEHHIEMVYKSKSETGATLSPAGYVIHSNSIQYVHCTLYS